MSNVKRKVSDVTKYKRVKRPTYWVVRESIECLKSLTSMSQIFGYMDRFGAPGNSFYQHIQCTSQSDPEIKFEAMGMNCITKRGSA